MLIALCELDWDSAESVFKLGRWSYNECTSIEHGIYLHLFMFPSTGPRFGDCTCVSFVRLVNKAMSIGVVSYMDFCFILHMKYLFNADV